MLSGFTERGFTEKDGGNGLGAHPSMLCIRPTRQQSTKDMLGALAKGKLIKESQKAFAFKAK